MSFPGQPMGGSLGRGSAAREPRVGARRTPQLSQASQHCGQVSGGGWGRGWCSGTPALELAGGAMPWSSIHTQQCPASSWPCTRDHARQRPYGLLDTEPGMQGQHPAHCTTFPGPSDSHSSQPCPHPCVRDPRQVGTRKGQSRRPVVPPSRSMGANRGGPRVQSRGAGTWAAHGAVGQVTGSGIAVQGCLGRWSL